MNENLQINTRVRRLFHYIDDFQKGIIRVPAFQRDFVWKMKDKLELLDSIKRGYPIGSILFWRPDLKSNNNFLKFESDKIGSYYIPERGSDYFYILDGYQRISTLFGCLVNPKTTNLQIDEEEWRKEFNLIYNLHEDKFEYHRKTEYDLIYKVPLYKFVDSKEFFGFQKDLSKSELPGHIINDYLKKYENLSSRLVDYVIPSIDIIGGSIFEAVDIFSRVNSTGAKITDDWKITALSYNQEKQFRLGTEIDNLLEELKEYNFHRIKRNLILQCIINSFGDVFFDQSKANKIEELARKEDFVDNARATFRNIKKAVKFLYNDILVLDSKLLPYGNQLVYMTDFFSLIANPTSDQLGTLRKWFWITSYSSYFTIYNLTKQRLAYRKFMDFVHGLTDDPIYADRPSIPFSVLPFPKKIDMGSVRSKSLVLFILNHQRINLRIEEGKRDFQITPLFGDLSMLGLDKGISENMVIQYLSKHNKYIGKRPKDFSWTLTSLQTFDDIFITSNIKENYIATANKLGVLEQRKRNIISAENTFIEAFGLRPDEVI